MSAPRVPLTQRHATPRQARPHPEDGDGRLLPVVEEEQHEALLRRIADAAHETAAA
jgi:hypothetical protein